ncbi:4320_t:CDS:2 [Diversispora eburnea]|uniref:4320_t:CDS:1 n=1 Tax=Diversispora eburnea TaxID=1213867 RepID=A0A9N9B4X7_9GLOM|nr:4320_t:CDS:2 [Diversispora eburnea]
MNDIQNSSCGIAEKAPRQIAEGNKDSLKDGTIFMLTSRVKSTEHLKENNKNGYETNKYQMDLVTNDEKQKDISNDVTYSQSDSAFDKMVSVLNSLITEATMAVETPVKGREKNWYAYGPNQVADLDFSDINNALDELDDEDESDFDEKEGWESEESSSENGEEDNERGRKLKKGDKSNKRNRSKSRHEELFEYSMSEFNKSLTEFTTFFDSMTMTDNTNKDSGVDPEGYVGYDGYDEGNTQYWESKERNEENLADLDGFSQQSHFLTRAIVLPFLHFTHSFMIESLQGSKIYSENGRISTTRTFISIIYWTFLFTLSSLVLDSLLCEISGRQVIKMVELLINQSSPYSTNSENPSNPPLSPLSPRPNRPLYSRKNSRSQYL